jgi:hypothetical protein
MALAFACVVGACGGNDDGHPAGIDDPSAGSPQAQAASSAAADAGNDPCVDFQKRECVIDLGVVNGVHNCTKGVQVCEGGQWTTCAVPDP